MRRIHLLFLFALLLGACGSKPPASVSQSVPQYVLVTAVPNPTMTATPFMPSLATPTSPLPQLPTYVPTATATVPTLTSTPVPTATSTADLSSLYPPAGEPPSIVQAGDAPAAMPELGNNETINFLLIGSDKRSGASFRTDTMVIVILRPREKQVTMISIPRDLWVYIPTMGMQRINTAYQYGEIYSYPTGGAGLLRDTIQYNLGLRIDHTAMVDFDGFRRIVDTLGGIDVPVACSYTDWHLISPDLDQYNEDNWEMYTVGPGVVHMDGNLALWYARSRSKSNDFDRGRRQQEVLRSIFDRALRTDTLTKIPQLYGDFQSTIVTDLNLPALLQLGLLAPQFGNADIRSYYIRPPLVTPWITDQGAYVLLPNQEALKTMFSQALAASSQAVQRESTLIEIQNGTPNAGWEQLAAARLNYAGYETRIIPAERSDFTYSVLVDLRTNPDQSESQTVLAILGLSFNNLANVADPNTKAVYRLIIGSDYRPCFQPESLTP
jgi:LCP family protein required for cell wall assembly